MGKARRADLAAVGLVGAVRHEIDAELALGRFHCGIDLALGHLVALGVKLEVMNQRFHRALHLAALRRHNLAIGRGDGSGLLLAGEQFHALLHDLHRLAHLAHADQIAVVAVAVLADRNVEVEFGIALIGLGAAQVPGGAGAAHHHAGEAPLEALLQRHDADIDVALLEDAVIGEKAFDVVEHLVVAIAEMADVVDQRLRNVLVHAARAHIGRMHAGA